MHRHKLASCSRAKSPKSSGGTTTKNWPLLRKIKQQTPCRLEITHGCDPVEENVVFSGFGVQLNQRDSGRPTGTPRTTRPWMRGSRRTFPRHTTAVGSSRLASSKAWQPRVQCDPWFHKWVANEWWMSTTQSGCAVIEVVVKSEQVFTPVAPN